MVNYAKYTIYCKSHGAILQMALNNMNTYLNLYLLIILPKMFRILGLACVTFPQKRGFAPLDLRVHPD